MAARTAPSPTGTARMANNPSTGWARYFTKPLWVILFLEITGGLPLALTASTLAAWLSDSHVDKTAIGIFALVATPYMLKFLWAPFMDGLQLPLLGRVLGRRRSWLLLTQIALLAALIAMGFTQPEINPWMVAWAALLVAFLSASQDIVIDAYRVELLPESEQGQGAAMAQLGYRLGMLLSGAGGLYLAARLGWQPTYIIMGLCMSIGIVTTLLAKEPSSYNEGLTHSLGSWLHDYVVAPFADFMTRPSWWLVLLFIILYRLADAFIGIMSNPFLLELGFTKETIAGIVKIYGTIAMLLGTFIGGVLTARFGQLRILFVAGLLHALTNLLYAAQAHIGPDAHFLAASVMVENISGGVLAAAFVAYLSALCNRHYTATQYALLSAIAAVARTFLATPAGYVAKTYGWEQFFLFAALLALPGLLILYMLSKQLKAAP